MSTKYLYDNLVTLDETVLTPDAVDAFYPVSNLKQLHTVDEFRTPNGTTTSNLIIDFKTVRNITDFALVGNNATNELNVTAITIEANPTSNFSAPAFTTTLLSTDFDFEENIAFHSFATQAYRFWRIVATTGAGFVGYSNIFLGESLSTPNELRSFSYGWKFERIDNSKAQKGRYGQKFIDEINDQKMFSGDVKIMEDATHTNYQTMIDIVGITKGIFLLLDSTENIITNKEIFAGYVQFNRRPMLTNTFFKRYDTAFQLLEVI